MSYENRFCPNCGSGKVEPDTRHTNVLGEAIFNTNKWFCNDCGYAGVMPEGKPETEDGEKFEFESMEQPKIDTDAGKAYIRVEIVFILLMIIFAALFILLT